ncbi:4820_t:CDS:2 [Entrophospora sp. SA101]|nr:6583_t:CDS:2 [Entrophospora sp. SA101]CAJ0651407.1 4820_t:CDS:2 [Entrophospora sp. SA101]
MRPKRAKQYKRLMTLYNISYGFREPYQVLVDYDFINIALRYKMDICKQLNNVMMGNTKQMYTSCTLNELRKQGGKDEFGTEDALIQLERRNCFHQRKPVSSAECLASIIEKDNPHNYCVATQNDSLRELFRNVPGVPLLYIKRSVLIIEPASRITLEKSKQIEMEKTKPSNEEISFLTNANSDILLLKKSTMDGSEEKKKNKRKGPKQPNPLSCGGNEIKMANNDIQQVIKIILILLDKLIH